MWRWQCLQGLLFMSQQSKWVENFRHVFHAKKDHSVRYAKRYELWWGKTRKKLMPCHISIFFFHFDFRAVDQKKWKKKDLRFLLVRWLYKKSLNLRHPKLTLNRKISIYVMDWQFFNFFTLSFKIQNFSYTFSIIFDKTEPYIFELKYIFVLIFLIM